MEWEKLIDEIKRIVREKGGFISAYDEVDGSGIVIGELGPYVALAACFEPETMVVEIFKPEGFSSDAIDEYDLKYEDLDKGTLEAVYNFITKL